MNKKFLVFGLGYVGLSNSILLSKNNYVEGIDIDVCKINKLKNKISPIKESELQQYLLNEKLNFNVSEKYNGGFDVDYILIATPTNYDEETQYFDTSSIEQVLQEINKIGTDALIVIKSTIPIGFTRKMNEEFKKLNIVFSPEFLREGKSLYDNLFPSRIVVGVDFGKKQLLNKVNEYLSIVKNSVLKSDMKCFVVGYEEAECTKLFANTYLAMRVAYFNELDNYAHFNNLNAQSIIDCVCADDRIGNFYNNPSFGYGGYCLPKDTKQLLSEFNVKEIPSPLISSITKSNIERKQLIADDILRKTKKTDVIGVYKIAMKSNSDNCRESAVIDIIKLIAPTRKILIYENNNYVCENYDFNNVKFTESIDTLKQESNFIICNRKDKELDDVINKVYTRDIFHKS